MKGTGGELDVGGGEWSSLKSLEKLLFFKYKRGHLYCKDKRGHLYSIRTAPHLQKMFYTVNLKIGKFRKFIRSKVFKKFYYKRKKYCILIYDSVLVFLKLSNNVSRKDFL